MHTILALATALSFSGHGAVDRPPSIPVARQYIAAQERLYTHGRVAVSRCYHAKRMVLCHVANTGPYLHMNGWRYMITVHYIDGAARVDGRLWFVPNPNQPGV